MTAAEAALQALDAANAYCVLPERPEPCTIVIFGGSGDLAARKLFPALASLYAAGSLPERFAIVAAARTGLDDQSFRGRMADALARAGSFDPLTWDTLSSRIFYCQVNYDSPEHFQTLAQRLEQVEAAQGLPGARVYYLAVPPAVYGLLAENLGRAGLAAAGQNAEGRSLWRRLVVEKPFGRDLASARELDRQLHRWFAEEQIFRIDHYLAKETVQNIALLRFANAVFEPVWNRNYVEYVSIFSAEDLGVEHRAGYYDTSGVLRDMFQNHMMQLMALAAMEPPSLFAAERVRDEKAKVFRSLRPFAVESHFQDLALGQYTAGAINGKEVPGYRQEPNIPPDSVTPTFAMIRAYIDNWRWQGVPFYIASGKRLPEKLTRIVIQFKDAPHSMFRAVLSGGIAANRLLIEAYPEQAIDMTFQVKQPGPTLCLRPAALRYALDGEAQGPILDAYEKVLLDCMLGDQTLFLRQDAVELCWGFLTPILNMCESCGDLDRWLKFYPAGSWGPEEANMIHLNYLRDLTRGQDR